MEELTKHQLILLALLVSFVTSIATGIVTVSLMDQAPAGVTQTVNRIVERTVERVVPSQPETGSQQASVITKEITVVVDEDDLVTDSIALVSESILPIYQVTKDASGKPTQTFVRFGTALNAYTLATSAGGIVAGEAYITVLGDDTVVPLVITHVADGEFALLSQEMQGTTTPRFAPIGHIDPLSIKRGQSVISLGGNTRNAVGTGIIAAHYMEEVVSPDGTSTETEGEARGEVVVTKKLVGFDVTLTQTPTLLGGGIFTQFGELIGVHTKTEDNIAYVTPSSTLLEALTSSAQTDKDIDE